MAFERGIIFLFGQKGRKPEEIISTRDENEDQVKREKHQHWMLVNFIWRGVRVVLKSND